MESSSNQMKRKHRQDDFNSGDRSSKNQRTQESNGEALSRNNNHASTEQIASRSNSRNSVPSQAIAHSRKIANLMRALHDALEEDGINDILGLIGDEALTKCRNLWTSLRKCNLKLETTAAGSNNPHPASPTPDRTNVPKTVSAIHITPWTSATIVDSLPPLPPVLNKTLEEAAFTHSNVGTGKLSNLEDYERLEWVGDAYLQLTSTLLLSQTFPALGPGKLSQLRERLVRNSQLAEYAEAYGFRNRAIVGHNFEVSKQEWIKIMGDMLEAYTAAVILSDPENGVTIASKWLKDVWGRSLKKEILQEEQKDDKWQSPIWKLVRDAGEREAYIAPPNFKDQLQKLLGSRGVKLVYKDAEAERKDRRSKLPVFTVGVYLDGWGETGKYLGHGSGNGKKEAGMKAAEMALKNKKLLSVYLERKRIYDEQMELERQALEKSKALETAKEG